MPWYIIVGIISVLGSIALFAKGVVDRRQRPSAPLDITGAVCTICWIPIGILVALQLIIPAILVFWPSKGYTDKRRRQTAG